MHLASERHLSKLRCSAAARQFAAIPALKLLASGDHDECPLDHVNVTHPQ